MASLRDYDDTYKFYHQTALQIGVFRNQLMNNKLSRVRDKFVSGKINL